MKEKGKGKRGTPICLGWKEGEYLPDRACLLSLAKYVKKKWPAEIQNAISSPRKKMTIEGGAAGIEILP